MLVALIAGALHHQTRLEFIPRTSTRQFAAPRSKLPSRRVDVSCANCGALLYRYAKGNGSGSQLVKVYAERIVKDMTDGGVECPACGQVFSRPAMIHGRPAFKIIGGKVRVS